MWHFGKGKGFGQMPLGSKPGSPACSGINITLYPHFLFHKRENPPHIVALRIRDKMYKVFNKCQQLLPSFFDFGLLDIGGKLCSFSHSLTFNDL